MRLSTVSLLVAVAALASSGHAAEYLRSAVAVPNAVTDIGVRQMFSDQFTPIKAATRDLSSSVANCAEKYTAQSLASCLGNIYSTIQAARDTTGSNNVQVVTSSKFKSMWRGLKKALSADPNIASGYAKLRDAAYNTNGQMPRSVVYDQFTTPFNRLLNALYGATAGQVSPSPIAEAVQAVIDLDQQYEVSLNGYVNDCVSKWTIQQASAHSIQLELAQHITARTRWSFYVQDIIRNAHEPPQVHVTATTTRY